MEMPNFQRISTINRIFRLAARRLGEILGLGGYRKEVWQPRRFGALARRASRRRAQVFEQLLEQRLGSASEEALRGCCAVWPSIEAPPGTHGKMHSLGTIETRDAASSSVIPTLAPSTIYEPPTGGSRAHWIVAQT